MVAIWMYTITFLQLFCMSEICLKMLGVKVILRKKDLCTKIFMAAFITQQQGKNRSHLNVLRRKSFKKENYSKYIHNYATIKKIQIFNKRFSMLS